MSEYSEKELLMLSNFVYLPCSLYNKSIEEILDMYRDGSGYFTNESVAPAGKGGGFSNEEICVLFTEMNRECKENPDFGKLSAARQLNGGYVRAVCYTGQKDDEAVIAFRGTGGSSAAWTDNFKGGYENDTKMQKLSADFVRNECSAYNNITVTGHSKGGNLSQYVTVACSGQIKNCVSFDGQGFNEEFINSNKEAVSEAAGKIKSISAYNDFVNILLTPIAGCITYVNNGSGIADAHSSLALLVNNEYDQNGNFTTKHKQSAISGLLKNMTDRIVREINPYDTLDKSLFSFLAGSTISTALCAQREKLMSDTGGSLMAGLSTLFLKKIADRGAFDEANTVVVINEIYFDNTGVRRTIDEYDAIVVILKELIVNIEDVNERIARNITMKIYSERKLMVICDNIETIVEKINRLSMTLEDVRSRYEEREKNLSDYVSEGLL